MTTLGAVSEVLRRFLPEFSGGNPPLSPAQRRAIWAIEHCRSAAMGGQAYACSGCGSHHFAYHSCNHKACPLCGREAAADWVQRELSKRVGAPYFMATFTLPQEARTTFFGPQAKAGYDAFFAASSGALAEKLATAKGFGAAVSGFAAVLHTWNQQLLFHPHIHILVPGAGLDAAGRVVTLSHANFLIHRPLLQAAFKEHYYRQLEALGWRIDPSAWRKDWGVDIRPFGTGATAVMYLGAYVARTAIGDARIVACDSHTVTFKWKDRSDHDRTKLMTLPGVEFVSRYLRHVLPRGLRSIRYYGFCHPAGRRTLERIQFHTGRPLYVGPATAKQPPRERPVPVCPRCRCPMRCIGRIRPSPRVQSATPRGPPAIAA